MVNSLEKKKTVAESRAEIAQVMMPSDANPAGNVHGGVIMKMIDEAAAIPALRHSQKVVVTASVDKIDFIYPVYVGNLVVAKASVNYVGKTSMEIGVRVESENLKSGKKLHVNSAYLTYVALDPRGRPTEIPPIYPETPEEKRRYEDAIKRRQARLEMRTRHSHEKK